MSVKVVINFTQPHFLLYCIRWRNISAIPQNMFGKLMLEHWKIVNTMDIWVDALLVILMYLGIQSIMLLGSLYCLVNEYLWILVTTPTGSYQARTHRLSECGTAPGR